MGRSLRRKCAKGLRVLYLPGQCLSIWLPYRNESYFVGFGILVVQRKKDSFIRRTLPENDFPDDFWGKEYSLFF